MKKIFILLWVMVVLFFVSACSLSSNQRGKNESVRVIKNDMEFGNYKIYQWNKEISFPFPSPEAKSYEVSDSNGVFCKGTTKADFNNYLEVLKNDGWEELDNSIEGGYQPIYYILIKDNMVLNITDQTMVDENYIEVKFTKGYMSTESKGRLSKDEAIKLIQEDINHITVKDQFGYGKSVYRLVELYIEDAFEKMGVQAYAAFDKAGQINNYLICKGSICGAPFLDKTFVVDIDKDGAYELLNACGWGSGIYRIELTAYKFSSPPESSSRIRVLHPAYSNCYIPEKGYAQLMLVKVNDTEVKLFGADRVKGELVPTTDYGILKINGYRLYTDVPDFPFHEW